MPMIDLEAELQTLTPADAYRLYAERLQVWRLCGSAACRRAQACRDPLDCCRRFANWADSVKAAAQRERDAGDATAEALRAELGRRLLSLAQTMRDDA